MGSDSVKQLAAVRQSAGPCQGRSAAAALAVVLLAVLGCAEPAPVQPASSAPTDTSIGVDLVTESDGSPDVAADPGGSAQVDADSSGSGDVAADTVADTAADAVAETAGDAAADAPKDADAGAAADVGPDTSGDAKADSDADALADAAVSADAKSDADAALEVGADGVADGAADAKIDSAADAGIDATVDAIADSGPKDIVFGWDAGKDVAVVGPCSPALKITPASPQVLPLQLLNFQATGGTGQYRFLLTKNSSEALVNLYTGAYLAGDKAGVLDTVQLTDVGCQGSASAQVEVLSPLAVLPAEAELPPGGKLALQVAKGSGKYAYSLKTNQSGGAITAAGVYTAGAKAGLDTLQVLDTGTGETQQIPVTVIVGSALAAVPPRLAIPVGSTAKLTVTGGSGVLQSTAKGPQITTNGSDVTAVAPGLVTVAIVDKLTGQTTTATVEVVAAQVPTMPRSGDFFEVAAAVAGDLDGDGWTDALLGVPESDITHYNDGAVYLYRGTPVGLSTEPSQVLHGALSEDRFGYAMVAGDVSGTAQPEVIVGAPLADAGAADAGLVAIFGWDAKAAKLAAQPLRQLYGPFASDQFGTAVAVCDFNGDGQMDLAVGAPLGENRDASPVLTDQGAVHVFLGNEDGFLDQAEQKVYGTLPGADGSWKGSASLRLGQTLAAGDFNGDGACDLAVTALNHSMPGGAAGDGAVFVYRGVKASKETLGGVSTLPVLAWQPTLASGTASALGRWLAAGDLDGDGKAELAVTQRNHDALVGTVTAANAGAVRIFKGGVLPTAAPAELGVATAANWTVQGPKANDAFGAAVAMGDGDGDGKTDLLVGHAAFELTAAPGAPALPTDTGVLALYQGKTGALPDTTPTQQWAGLANGVRFGLAMVALPKSAPGPSGGSAAAKPGILVYAANSSDLGPHVGRPYWLVPGKTMTALGMPGVSSGHRFGTAAAFPGDFDGDGAADLVAGAFNFDDPKGNESNTGDLWLWSGVGAGLGAAPGFDWLDFVGHSAADQVGYAMAAAGNFDGDGRPDLAVIARSEDVPATFSKSYVTVPGSVACIADPVKPNTFKAASDTGAVYVFGAGAAGSPLSSTPRWVIFGPQASQVLDSVAGGFDYDGDGLDDLAIGSLTYDPPGRVNAGGVLLVRGRKQSATPGIHVQCPDAVLAGVAANDNFGRSVTGVADVDGDGCDEIAVGAPGADLPGKNDQGAVYLIFGYGDACQHKVAEWLVLYSGEASAQAGFAVAAGDLDGDALGDLVVGAVGHLKAGNQVGAAWVVRGSYLSKFKGEPWVDGTGPADKPPLLDPAATGLAVEGWSVGERAGSAVAVVPRVKGPGFAGIIVGSPLGSASGTALSGQVRVHRFDPGGAGKPAPGLTTAPALVLTGETVPGLGRMGDAVAVGWLAGKPVLAAGAPTASPAGKSGADTGAIYTVSLANLQ